MPNKLYLMNVDPKLLRQQRQSLFKVRTMNADDKEGLMALLEHVDNVAHEIPVIRNILYFDATVVEVCGEDAVEGGFKFYHHYLVEAKNEEEAMDLIDNFMADFFDDGVDDHRPDGDGVYLFYDGQNRVWLDMIKMTTPEAFMMTIYRERLIKSEVTGDEINRSRNYGRRRIHEEEADREQHGGVPETERESGDPSAQD